MRNLLGRLERAEANVRHLVAPERSPAAASLVVLSCLREYLAGGDAGEIAAKMRRSGADAETVRFYCEEMFATAATELSDWREQNGWSDMDASWDEMTR